MIARAPKWAQIVAFGLTILVVLGIVSLIYSLASGKSLLGGGAAAAVMFFAIFAYNTLHDKQSSELPQQLDANLQNSLLSQGITGYRFALGDRILQDGYPLPMVLGKRIYISPAMIDDLTPRALAWITLAETNADRKEPKYLPVILGMFVVACVAAAGLLDRYSVAFPGWAALIATLPLMLFALTKVAHASHLQADRELPRSDDDLMSAKEAFSYAYFAQAERSILNKFNFSKTEIRQRAAALGVELERGFKATEYSEPDSPRPS